MGANVVQLAAKRSPATVIEGVIARSTTNEGKREDAWVSVVTSSKDHILVVQFPSTDYGEEAWARAVKYGKGFAERLGVEFRKKRTSH